MKGEIEQISTRIQTIEFDFAHALGDYRAHVPSQTQLVEFDLEKKNNKNNTKTNE